MTNDKGGSFSNGDIVGYDASTFCFKPTHSLDLITCPFLERWSRQRINTRLMGQQCVVVGTLHYFCINDRLHHQLKKCIAVCKYSAKEPPKHSWCYGPFPTSNFRVLCFLKNSSLIYNFNSRWHTMSVLKRRRCLLGE